MSLKILNNESNALSESNNREIVFINYECPFAHQRRACGSWCALFTINSSTRSKDNVEHTRIELRCGDGRSFHKSEQK